MQSEVKEVKHFGGEGNGLEWILNRRERVEFTFFFSPGGYGAGSVVWA